MIAGTGLPLPFENFILRYIRDLDSESVTSMCRKANGQDQNGNDQAVSAMGDAAILKWRKEVIDLRTLVDPVKCPYLLLDELGYMLGAGIIAGDSSDVKRHKCAVAISGHKNLGTWLYDIKPKIDAISGYSATILSFTGDVTAWILMGSATDRSGTNWGILGADGTAITYGMDLVGEGAEVNTPGVTLVDVGTSGLSAAQVSEIVTTIAPLVPAYFRLILGYLTGTTFTAYSGGTIH